MPQSIRSVLASERIPMSAPTVVQLDGWEDFKNVVGSRLFPLGAFERGVYLFRGHGSAGWPLMASFDRWYQGRDPARKANAAERLLALFQKESEGLDVDVAVWSDEVRRLSLAQHYGIPTRLLDWTESPYVAAFFAFAAIGLVPRAEEHVAVWVLDTRSPIWSREFGVELLDVPGEGNDRLRAQLGRFSLLRAPYDTLEEYVAHFPSGHEALRQYLLPSREAAIALADLDVMGINYSRVFPGLEGSARAARLRLSFELAR